MIIKLDPSLSEAEQVCISTVPVLLQQVMGVYEQVTEFAETELVSLGLTVLPIVAYGPHRFSLKSKTIRNPIIHARFAVYSKKPEEERQCGRFVNDESTGTLEEVLEKMPVPIREGYFDLDGESTLAVLLSALSGVKADRVKFMYSPVTCEGVISHCVAVVYEFGPDKNPNTVVTAYFNIIVGK